MNQMNEPKSRTPLPSRKWNVEFIPQNRSHQTKAHIHLEALPARPKSRWLSKIFFNRKWTRMDANPDEGNRT